MLRRRSSSCEIPALNEGSGGSPERRQVIILERSGKQIHIRQRLGDGGIMVDARGGIEQLHGVGDAKTLAVADHRDSRPAGRLLAFESGETGAEKLCAPRADNLFVDLRNHKCEAP